MVFLPGGFIKILEPIRAEVTVGGFVYGTFFGKIPGVTFLNTPRIADLKVPGKFIEMAVAVHERQREGIDGRLQIHHGDFEFLCDKVFQPGAPGFFPALEQADTVTFDEAGKADPHKNMPGRVLFNTVSAILNRIDDADRKGVFLCQP
jgi:hypothetical protein